MELENYVYKKEIDWSTLMEGFTLPLDNQVIFLRNMENFLQRGQSKIIHFFMNGKTYDAKIVNMNNSVEKRKKDAYQIRYPRNGELSQALQQYFFKSMSYIKMIRESRDPKDRSYIKMPDGLKEYLAIYTTEYEDTFLLEPIAQDDFQVMKKAIQGMRERTVENEIEYEMEDKSSGIEKRLQIVKIRKLNRKIGENLKLLYGYRCQICGQVIGEKYGSHIAEAHHIDYFVNSLNNDANNQMIVCPNHHSVIHDANPVFDRRRMEYCSVVALRKKSEQNFSKMEILMLSLVCRQICFSLRVFQCVFWFLKNARNMMMC